MGKFKEIYLKGVEEFKQSPIIKLEKLISDIRDDLNPILPDRVKLSMRRKYNCVKLIFRRRYNRYEIYKIEFINIYILKDNSINIECKIPTIKQPAKHMKTVEQTEQCLLDIIKSPEFMSVIHYMK